MEERAPSRAVFLEEPNKGYAAGLNLAVEYLLKAQPEIDTVLAINPDVQLEAGVVEKLRDRHAREKADATFPTIREDNLLIRGYELARYGTLRRVKNSAHLFPGTCFLFSIEAWKKVGGFDESYFHYFEDLDFCEKIHRLGGKICHVQDLVIDHAAKSGENYPATDLPGYAVRNHLRFARQYGKMNRITFWNICLRHLFYLFRWRGFWRGIPKWRAGIREFRELRMNHGDPEARR